MIKFSKTLKTHEIGDPQQSPILAKQTDKIFILKEQKPELSLVPRAGKGKNCYLPFPLNVLL